MTPSSLRCQTAREPARARCARCLNGFLASVLMTVPEESQRVGLTGSVAHVPALIRRARFLLPTGLSRLRKLISAGLAIVVLTLLTLILDARSDDVSTTIIFLLYLAAVVALS